MKTKICARCKKEKSIKEFSNYEDSKDGLAYQCKECIEEYNKQYHKDNSECIKEAIKGYKKEYYKKWQAANPEKIKEIHEKI